MDGINILFVREEQSLDNLIKERVASLLGCDININYTDIFKTAKPALYCEFFYRCQYEIIIYQGSNLNLLIENAGSLPAVSVIYLCDQSEVRSPFWVNKKFFEFFPIDLLNSNPEMLILSISKSILLLEKFYENHHLLDTIFQLMPDGITLVDTSGIIIHTNAHITEYSNEELVGKSIFNFLDDNDLPVVKAKMKDALIDHKIKNFRVSLKSKDGRLIPTEVNAVVLTNSEGIPVNFLAVLTDISAKKEVWEKEQFLTHVIESSRDGIITLDKEMKITLWNKGDEEIFGYSASEMIGQEIFKLCADSHMASIYKECVEKLKTEGFINNLIVKCRRKDGQLIDLEMTLCSLFDEDESFMGASATIRNVSQIKMSLEEAQKRNEEMEHLINVVSHDLRSPLSSIDNYITFIHESMKDKVDSEEVLEMFERIYANITNMESLIRDLTNFSRAGLLSGDEVAVDLNSVIGDIVCNLQWQVGKNNFLVESDKMPTIRIDPHRIHQVFENLISNAYKFRKDGECAKAEIRVSKNASLIKFSVKDHGIGINKKHHNKIFNLFFRTKEKPVDGSGAGLAIARRIINTYGGDIWVESTPENGTAFHFTLPSSLMVEE